MSMDGNGIVPVMNVNGGYGYGDCYGGFGGGFMWLIVLFALLGGNGFGWGRGNGLDTTATFANGSMTRNQISDEFAYNDIKNGIRGVQNGMCDGFYAQNTAMLQGFNSIGRDTLESRYQIGSQIAENRYQLGSQLSENRFAAQQCCCETNRNIDAVRSENYKNTCEITNTIRAEGEATRALINANAMQDLRDKLEERDRALMTANFQLSQQAQSANLIDTLRPCPIPAYPVCSPYVSYCNNYSNCGC